ncbi:AzlC family ABC transporter permease [Rothia sp. AR01]|uniref:AzlC family ABC transporter permease n=1 Tax=Rothia santali TaxID=2949643 RepID=A0A9X2HD60_9MICC|nr:AzlC family ABC transporter permease [Rothia santali]MCP3426105.1 AzlC family ABC transporter permease [Rothia santali]
MSAPHTASLPSAPPPAPPAGTAPGPVPEAAPGDVRTDDVEPAASERPAASDFRAALRSAGVIWLGIFVLGIGFGVLVTAHGLPWWLAPVISATVFAGSVEFVLIGLIAAGAPLAGIALTTFLMNSRHLFYGLSYPLHRIRSRWGRLYAIFSLCDEAFAILSSRDPRTLTGGRMIWTHVGMHAGWATGAVLGGLTGATLLSGVEGLDFILTALFIVLAVDAYLSRPDPLTAVLAGVSAVVAILLVPGSMLPVAMAVFLATLVARFAIASRRSRRA